jgi:hypothetical protein
MDFKSSVGEIDSPLMVSFVLSLIMHRLVSRDTLTVASNGIWNATLMYCVRIVGTCKYVDTHLFLIMILLFYYHHSYSSY